MEFIVLYTHQKNKKHKTWQDGRLVYTMDKKSGRLYNEQNEVIDTINHNSELKVDDVIESQKFLITIDSLVDKKENIVAETKEIIPAKRVNALRFKSSKPCDITANTSENISEQVCTDRSDSDILAALLTGNILKNTETPKEKVINYGDSSKIRKTEDVPSLPHIPSSDKTKILSILQSFKNKPKIRSSRLFLDIESYSVYLLDIISDTLSYLLQNSLELSLKILKKNEVNKVTQKYFKEGHSDSFIYMDCKLISTHAKKNQFNLKLSDIAPNDIFSSDDLWILSKDINFSHFIVASSNCYRPNNSNEILINFPDELKGSDISKSNCNAIHVGNVFNEFACFCNIQNNLTAEKVPLMDYLLCKTKTKLDLLTTCMNTEQESIIEAYCEQYGKNKNMKEAIKKLGHYFCLDDKNTGIICIQGVFGSGKSELIAICCIMLDELLNLNESCHSDSKILVSALTNIAVDNIMLKLERLSFTKFERVGIQNKINPILRKKRTKSFGLSFDKENQPTNTTREIRVFGVTCASAVLSKLDSKNFDYIFIDEATQITEPHALNSILPFKCKKLVLIGDPKQLGPVVHSKNSINPSQSNSLFKRMCDFHTCPIVLNTQYRCHPEISAISNRLFYSNIIMNGNHENISVRLSTLPVVSFINVKEGETKSKYDGSWCNKVEAEFILTLILKLKLQSIQSYEMGVISFYKAQCELILKLLEINNSRTEDLKVSTVDAFQGSEKEIIILSCTRDKPSEFMLSDQRINVALTRAKKHLIIVGNQNSLSSISPWSSIIQTCQNNHCIFTPQSFLKIVNQD